MKSVSITFALAFIIMSAVISGCSKAGYSNNAVITGYDMRTCACCGGLYMNFNNSPVTNIATSYDVTNTPSSLGIDSNTHFPVYMQVNWAYVNQTSCPQDVSITGYALQ